MVKPEYRIKDLKEISIAIDTWDDIFSDFDPRPVSERVVSEDFIFELKRRYREVHADAFVITICAPLVLKDTVAERKVIMRLKMHFRQRYLRRKKEIRRIRIRGGIFVLIGISSLSFLTLAMYFEFFPELTIELLSIPFMPLGWFGIWEGLSKLIDTSPAFIQEEVLFDRLSRTNYRFKYIEEHRE